MLELIWIISLGRALYHIYDSSVSRYFRNLTAKIFILYIRGSIFMDFCFFCTWINWENELTSNRLNENKRILMVLRICSNRVQQPKTQSLENMWTKMIGISKKHWKSLQPLFNLRILPIDSTLNSALKRFHTKPFYLKIFDKWIKYHFCESILSHSNLLQDLKRLSVYFTNIHQENTLCK